MDNLLCLRDVGNLESKGKQKMSNDQGWQSVRVWYGM